MRARGKGLAVANSIRVLVIDDTEAVRKVLVAQLRKLGYTAQTAENGEVGLASLRADLPDLVLCDLRMPRMDGLELLHIVREEFPHLPVIVMSGQGLLDDAVGALKLGAWDYITKPIEGLSVLEHALSRAIERADLLRANHHYRQHLEEANKKLLSSLRTLAEDEDAGRQLQSRMLPRNHQFFGDFEFSRDLVPSAYLSGDFVDAFAIDDSRWGFYLADVAGHGVSSALVTVLLKTFMQRYVGDFTRAGNGLVLSPGQLLSRLNEEVCKESLDKHLTIFYGVINTQEDSLLYANAGHFPWPFVFDGQQVIALEQPGVPVGLMPRTSYKEALLKLPPAVVLAAFSDGILEILPHKNLMDKLGFLRTLFCRLDVTVEGAHAALHLDDKDALPDDVAFLLVKRGDNHGRTDNGNGLLRPAY